MQLLRPFTAHYNGLINARWAFPNCSKLPEQMQEAKKKKNDGEGERRRSAGSGQAFLLLLKYTAAYQPTKMK